MASPRVNANELLKQIQRANTGCEDPVPQGFLDGHEWAKLWGITTRNAMRNIAAGVRAGILEQRTVRRFRGGRLHPVIYAAPVKR